MTNTGERSFFFFFASLPYSSLSLRSHSYLYFFLALNMSTFSPSDYLMTLYTVFSDSRVSGSWSSFLNNVFSFISSSFLIL